MEANYISTASLRNQPRLEINRLQSELSERTKELATGRVADVGLSLGSDTGRMVALRNEITLMETLMRSNGTAAARLTLIQAGLSDIGENAGEVLEALIALPPGSQAAGLLELEGQSALARLADRLNGSDGGSFIFGGTNTATAPFNRYDDGPQAAVEAAFLGKFGVAVGDPAASAITTADMADFLANEFASLFDDPSWTTDWSSASSTDIVTRIAISERTTTGTNTNEEAIRVVAEGLTMLAGLGLGSLNEQTRQVVVDAARTRLGQAVSDVAQLQGEIGFAQNAIAEANERMELARNLLFGTIADAEGADPAEAKVRVDLLTTQLEMSFALTGQLSRLSILNYA